MSEAILSQMSFSIFPRHTERQNIFSPQLEQTCYSVYSLICILSLFISLFNSLNHLELVQCIKIMYNTNVSIISYLEVTFNTVVSFPIFHFPYSESENHFLNLWWVPWSFSKAQILSNATDWFSVCNTYFDVLVREVHHHCYSAFPHYIIIFINFFCASRCIIFPRGLPPPVHHILLNTSLNYYTIKCKVIFPISKLSPQLRSLTFHFFLYLHSMEVP